MTTREKSKNTFIALTSVMSLLYLAHISIVLVITNHDVINEYWIGSQLVEMTTGTGYAALATIILIILTALSYFLRNRHGLKLMTLLMMLLLIHVVHIISLFV